MIGLHRHPSKQQALAAVQRILAADGGNKQGGLWMLYPAAMYAAPDGAALAGSGVGVGLLMDASKGMVLGNELVVNGDAEAAAMTLSTSRLLKAQSNTYAKTGTYSNRFTQETVGWAYSYFTGGVAGSLYSVSASIYIPTGTTITSVYLANGGGVDIGPNATVSTKGSWVDVSGWLFANGSAYGGFVVTGATVGDHFYVDNYSMKQVLGNHAKQATSAYRPMGLITPQTARNIFVPSGPQVLTVTMPNIGICTVLRPRPDGTIDIKTETINGAFNVTKTNDVFCGCVVVQGTLTSDQDYVLRQLFGWHRPGLGPNLIVNGMFADGVTGWTNRNAANLSTADGTIVITPVVPATYAGVYQYVVTEANSAYAITATRTLTNGSSSFIQAGTLHFGAESSSLLNDNSALLGVMTKAVIASNALTALILQTGEIAGSPQGFDNVSLCKVI